MESSRTARVLFMLFFSFLTGVALALFTQIDGMIKYAFSLVALLLVFNYFKRTEKISYRIIYVVLTLITFFIFIVVTTTYAYMRDNGML